METTKITVKVYEPLLVSFNQNIASCFIKRDAFLNHIILKELSKLTLSMKGLHQTNQARRYISGELKRLGTRTINVVVEKNTANELNEVVEKTNMVRDSFINRLILLLNASYEFLQMLELPTELNDDVYDFVSSIETSPLKGVTSIMEDPLFYLHYAMNVYQVDDLYRFKLPKQLVGMSCYLDDSDIPGSLENLEMRQMFEKISLDLKNIFNPTQERNNV